MAGPIAQWRNDLARLDAQLDRARERVADLRKPGAGATNQQIAQARLGELAAVKQYNDFLDTAKQGYDMARQYERRLSNSANLSDLERQQLENTRDALNARAGEFQQFANDNKLFPASAKPVQASGKIYYDNGHTEWDTSTFKGMAGAAGDSIKSALPVLADWITPNNASNNMACNSALGTLLGIAQGKVHPIPDATGHAGVNGAMGKMWDLAKEKAGDTTQPGDFFCGIPYPKNDPMVDELRRNGLISDAALPEGLDPEQYVVVKVPADLLTSAIMAQQVEQAVRNGDISPESASCSVSLTRRWPIAGMPRAWWMTTARPILILSRSLMRFRILRRYSV